MNLTHRIAPTLLIVLLASAASPAAELPLDESPAAQAEWGFRPADGQAVSLNPPRFSWRPQKGAKRYVVQASRNQTLENVEFEASDLEFNVHAPAAAFEPGAWRWRFRYVDAKGKASPWSSVRAFTIPPDAVKFPLPRRAELLARIPTSHPRLFVRPEQVPKLRGRAKADLKPLYDQLIAAAEQALANPTPTDEPPKYPPGTVTNSEEWRTLWWGARTTTQRTLNPAAELGFAYQLSGQRRYADEAKRILLAVAKWDPKGSTGYRYNDEAGMPYNYLFSRTYTFIHDVLTPAERATCRELMALRGREMYEHLCPSHFWTPYKSHQNRAWHKLGEVGIAFKDEIPEAGDWAWFAANVFANVYPVWNDDDGGWHEGLAYWRSYLSRFTWWADVMDVALGINAYDLPYFARVGYYPMYLQPPGTTWGGFGDLTGGLDSGGNVPLLAVFAAQAQNPHWQWYVDRHGGSQPDAGYVGFTRAARFPKVRAKPPTDLPSSRLFGGTGQAFLNSNLLDARDNVAVLFKSSPMGAMSHGYNAQNSFELYVGGRPVLVSSGRRDSYGSDHHKNWMWETKSNNNITVGGRGQIKHLPTAQGRVTAFHTSPRIDFVQGDASQAFEKPLKHWTRSVLFLKPDAVVIFDRLETERPEVFTYHLHAPEEMSISDDGGVARLRATNGDVGADIIVLAPAGLSFEQTDQFDAPLRPRVKLTQYHATATTPSPSNRQHFLTVIRPFRPGHPAPTTPARLTEERGGYILRLALTDGEAAVRLKLDAPPGEPDMVASVKEKTN